MDHTMVYLFFLGYWENARSYSGWQDRCDLWMDQNNRNWSDTRREGGRGKKVAATNKKFPRRQIDACFLLIKSLSGRWPVSPLLLFGVEDGMSFISIFGINSRLHSFNFLAVWTPLGLNGNKPTCNVECVLVLIRD